MEARELVPSSGEKDEASHEVRKEKLRIHDDVNDGKVLVVVSTTESERAAAGKRSLKRKIDDVSRHGDATSCSPTDEALDGNGDEDDVDVDDDDDDYKENAAEKSIPGESKLSRGNREVDKIFPLQQRTRANRSPRPPRPANAFMLFANEWRKKLAAENPRESNKDISVRLGICWKNMPKDAKEKYFALAREVDAEHKRKYPDYVYNPKEARLRKAMREQSREQSRERSRRSILQSAIAIANARTAAIGGPPAASLTGDFLSQHHRTFDCVPAAVPSVPMGPGIGPPHRATEAWFQATHRPKPVHSPRIGDWYGNVDGDPIERLQAMGTLQQQQQQQQQQRGLDKTSIKDQRSQVAECAAAFSNGHSPDFVAGEREIRRQESSDYAGFVDGQKWHPYQNSASPHPHPRTPHPSPQMAGILHPNVQNTSAHGHTHGPWGQFCHGMLPHIPVMTHNAAIRGPRHAVFLRDRPATKHCAFSDDTSRMSYAPSKLDIESIRASYPPAEHQMPRLLESAVDSVIDSTTTMNRREEDCGTRWEQGTVATDVSLDELVPTSMPQEDVLAREKERQFWRSAERFELKKKPVAKQPLPGFHQAFGSTEIGRFSRSEFFVNMVGENGGGGGGGDGGGGGGGDISETDSGDVSRERPPLLDTTGNAATVTAAAMAATAAIAARAATAATSAIAETTSAERTFDPEDQATFAVGDDVVGASYCRQPVTMPRWHSPHLIPEAYLTTPLLFPFPAHNPILGASAVHGISENGRLVSRILPNECCWFAQTGRAIAQIPDGLVTCAALLDYSHRTGEREWLRQKTTVVYPMEYPMLLGNPNAEYERIVCEQARRDYVYVGRERGNEAVNLKIDRDQNPLNSDAHEPGEKKN